MYKNSRYSFKRRNNVNFENERGKYICPQSQLGSGPVQIQINLHFIKDSCNKNTTKNGQNDLLSNASSSQKFSSFPSERFVSSLA